MNETGRRYDRGPELMRGGRRSRAPWLLAGLAIGFVATVVLVVRGVYDGKVLPRTDVAGMALGGSSESEVSRRLAAAVRADQPAVLAAAGRRWAVRPSRAGYTIDVDATAARALAAGREGPLAGAWSTLRGLIRTRSISPVATINPLRFRRATTSLVRRIDRAAFPGELIIDPDTLAVRLAPARTGRTVDRTVIRTALLGAFRRPTPTATPISVRRIPAIPAQRLREIRTLAEAFLSQPLKVRGAGPALTVPPAQLARIVAIEPLDRGRNARLGTNRPALTRLSTRLARRRNRQPRDARIQAPARLVSLESKGNVSWRPRRAAVRDAAGRTGRRVDRRALAKRVAAAVRAGRHRVSVPVRRIAPKITTRAARRVRSLIGTFTTRYEAAQPRVTNIRRIARAVDGTTVAPGDRFSLNAAAGPRTPAKGYVEAPFIADNEIVPSVGGGVSQFSTTLYNAVYFAGLRIDTHQPHSLYIDRYPAGREATLNFPDIDLVWTNNTDAPVLVRASSDATSVTVSLYGANGNRRVRAEAASRQVAPGGDFAITVTRVVRYADGRTQRQPFTTTYAEPQP